MIGMQEPHQDFFPQFKTRRGERFLSTSTYLNSPCICIIALAIDLSENIVAIIYRKKSVWGFEEVINSLTEKSKCFWFW